MEMSNNIADGAYRLRNLKSLQTPMLKKILQSAEEQTAK